MKKFFDSKTPRQQLIVGILIGVFLQLLAGALVIGDFFSSSSEARGYAPLSLGFIEIFASGAIVIIAIVLLAFKRHSIAQGMFISLAMQFLVFGACLASGVA